MPGKQLPKVPILDQLVEEYRIAKAQEPVVYDNTAVADSLLKSTQQIREEVFVEVKSGKCPSADRAFIALYGPEIAAYQLRQADAAWRNISEKMALLLEQIENRIPKP